MLGALYSRFIRSEEVGTLNPARNRQHMIRSDSNSRMRCNVGIELACRSVLELAVQTARSAFRETLQTAADGASDGYSVMGEGANWGAYSYYRKSGAL